MNTVNDTSNVLIAFGSNEGDSMAVYDRVKRELDRHSMSLLAASEPIQTEPIGGAANESQNPYLNAALLVETEADPEHTIQWLLKIEKELGRVRDRRWSPRTVDLDLLLFGQRTIEHPELTCPHPRMSYRRFVLEPAAEIATEMIHPVSGCTIGQLLEQLNTRPNVLVWAGKLPDEVQGLDGMTTQLGQQVAVLDSERINLGELAPKDSSFHICQVGTVEEFRQVEKFAKLVSFLEMGGTNVELSQAAQSFSGATLKLGANALDPRREIVSAIEAMH